MNPQTPMDNTVIPSWLAQAIGAAFLALGAYILKRYDHKIDAMETKIAEFVPREEIQEMFAASAQAQKDMHVENTGNFKALREEISEQGKETRDALREQNTLIIRALTRGQ